MAINDLPDLDINASEFYSSFWENIPEGLMTKIDFIIGIVKIILFAALAYIIILILIKILGFVLGSRETRYLKKLNRNVEEILEILKKGKQSERKEQEKETKKKR